MQLAIQFNVDDKYCILDQMYNRDQSILWFLLLAILVSLNFVLSFVRIPFLVESNATQDMFKRKLYYVMEGLGFWGGRFPNRATDRGISPSMFKSWCLNMSPV